MDKIKIGNAGESAVCRYLSRRGYKILDRNFKTRFGEIDIIAQKKNVISFVEVKTRKKDSMISGIDAVGFKKQQRVLAAAKEYIMRKRIEFQPRFDVAEVTNNGIILFRYKINYIEDAFSE